MTLTWQRAKYLLSDFLASSLAWVLFNILRFEVQAVFHGYSSLGSYLCSSTILLGQVFVPLFWLFLFWLSGFYNKPYGKSRLGEFFNTFTTVILGVTLLFFGMVLNDLPSSYEVYYRLFSVLFLLQFFLCYAGRACLTQDCIRKIRSGKYALNVLIIGTCARAQSLAAELTRQGYAVRGFIRDDDDSQPAVEPSSVVGGWSDLQRLIPALRIDELVIVSAASADPQWVKKLYSLYVFKIPVKVLLSESHPLARGHLRTIHGSPLLDVTDNNLSEAERNIKWLMDKLLSILALAALSPLLLYVAWRVKRDSDGPVFFKQERIGYRGRPFLIYKFRTMYIDAEQAGPSLSKEDDPRITPFGHTMRKYRIDELPQFWNVLRGDMSLVGPRPERMFYINKIVERAPYYYLLHNVKPGITSLGMVKYGYASDVEQMTERLKYDILYYENMSLALDITILFYTIQTVFTGKGI